MLCLWSTFYIITFIYDPFPIFLFDLAYSVFHFLHLSNGRRNIHQGFSYLYSYHVLIFYRFLFQCLGYSHILSGIQFLHLPLLLFIPFFHSLGILVLLLLSHILNHALLPDMHLEVLLFLRLDHQGDTFPINIQFFL